MTKLSIIVCVYNTEEKLFEECLTSIFSNSLESKEVIVVDDGSTIDYQKLIHKFNKIKYIKIENKGTLNARLVGLQNATGEYVCYADSDDIMSFDYYEALYENAKKIDADIFLGDWAFLTDRVAYVGARDYTIKNLFKIDGESVLRMFFYPYGKEQSWYVLWNKIFKRSLLEKVAKDIELLHIENQVFAEDVLMCFYAFSKAKIVSNIHLGYYFYRIHENQQTVENSKEKFERHFKELAMVFDFMERELKIINRFAELEYHFDSWKNLMASNNILISKNSKFLVEDEIKKAYHLEKISKSPKEAEQYYADHHLLPLNINEIDESLKKAFFSNKYLRIYAKKNSYAFRQLASMKKYLNKKFDLVEDKKSATMIMPKEKSSLKLKILHNYYVYKFGMLLFPKGSKIRKKLKSKI